VAGTQMLSGSLCIEMQYGPSGHEAGPIADAKTSPPTDTDAGTPGYEKESRISAR